MYIMYIYICMYLIVTSYHIVQILRAKKLRLRLAQVGLAQCKRPSCKMRRRYANARLCRILAYFVNLYTSSTAQGGGGSFKDRNTIGKVELLECRWRRDRWLECRCLIDTFCWSSWCNQVFVHLSFVYLFVYLTAYLPVHPCCLSIFLSIFLSISLSNYLSIHRSTFSFYLSFFLSFVLSFFPFSFFISVCLSVFLSNISRNHFWVI